MPQQLRTVRLGFIGLGVVGQGVLELLARQNADLAQRFGIALLPVAACVRDPNRGRGLHAAGIAMETDPLLLVARPDVDIVVDLAGGLAMWPAIEAALRAKKPVVTANKALIAQKLGELVALSQETGTPVHCEGAVAAALPILRSLGRRVDRITQVQAILNGTSNFVLTRMEQDEMPLEKAVALAQAKGFAEADPSADIDGHDAAAKLSILAHRALGIWSKPGAFPVRGIRELTPADFDLAEAMGHRIRHIAHADELPDGSAELAVEPMLLPHWHLLAGVEEEYNAVYLTCESAGDLSFFGKGAGGLPTATAVVGDLVDVALGTPTWWPTPNGQPLANPALRQRRHYVRIHGNRQLVARRIEDRLRKSGFSVQDRATVLSAGESMDLGFIVGPSQAAPLHEVAAQLTELEKVTSVLVLSLSE